MNSFKTIKILGINFTKTNTEEVLEFITKGLVNRSEKFYIVTPNPELLVIANTDSEYKKVLNSAKLVLPDGIGVILASKLLGNPLISRITGVDLTEMLCSRISKQIVTAGFLGSRPGVAELASECLQKKYPGLKVVFVADEWPKDYKGKIIDILFVAFGSPKQEFWINKNLDKLPVRVAIGVGGAFDFISGRVPRAPRILRKLGLEWLFRLIIQPWRIKRQLSLIKFIYLVVLEKLRRSPK